MAQLLEWSPLILFFIAFKVFDIYWATGVLMVACLVQLFVHRLHAGRFKPMHLITTAVVLVLGTATLLLHDRRFIQLKPTVLLGLAAAVFLGSQWIGRQPLARRMLEGVFEEPLQVSQRAWSTLNLLWVVWFAALALVNLYVARNFTESAWVNFKLFGIPVAALLFMLPQVFWLSSKVKPAAAVSHE
jgi:intracellular septation protein